MKATLKQIGAGKYFVAGGTAYVRGTTRWASYRIGKDGLQYYRSTRHDGRERFEVFATKQEAMDRMTEIRSTWAN